MSLSRKSILAYLEGNGKKVSILDLIERGVIPSDTDSRYLSGFLEAMQQMGEIRIEPDRKALNYLVRVPAGKPTR